MAINTTTINGDVFLPDGTVREKSYVIFEQTGFDTDNLDDAVIVTFPIRAPIAGDGSIDVDLWPNPDGVRTTFYRVTFDIYNGSKSHLVDGGKISVPATGGPYALNDLLPIAPPSGASVSEYIAQLAAAVASAEASAVDASASAAIALEAADPVNLDVIRDDIAALEAQSPVVLLENGAAGDGVTNDKAVIDAYNVANTTVDLGGREYLYAGAFKPALGTHYKNGKINSTVNGLFDFSVSLITGDKSVTVGAVGTFKNLQSAWDWALHITIHGTLDFLLLDKTSSTDANGVNAIDSQTMTHPQSNKIGIIGNAFGVGEGTIDATLLTHDAVADLAYVRSRYSSSVLFFGPGGTSGTIGWAFANGLRRVERVLFESLDRYSQSFGFSNSHSNSRGATMGCLYKDCAFWGGVWGIITSGVMINMVGHNAFLYQLGGPFDLMDGAILKIDIGSTLDLYTPKVAANSNQPTYGIKLENASVRCNGTGQIRMIGPFLHGFHAWGQSNVRAFGTSFDGVTQPVTAEDAAFVMIDGGSITNADPANTSLTAGSTQFGIRGNNGSGALLHAGSNATISLASVSISACICQMFVRAQGGKLIGWNNMSIDDSFASVRSIHIDANRDSNFGFNITNPRAGSNASAVAFRGGQAVIRGRGGLSFSPPLDTQVGPNAFWTA